VWRPDRPRLLNGEGDLLAHLSMCAHVRTDNMHVAVYVCMCVSMCVSMCVLNVLNWSVWILNVLNWSGARGTRMYYVITCKHVSMCVMLCVSMCVSMCNWSGARGIRMYYVITCKHVSMCMSMSKCALRNYKSCSVCVCAIGLQVMLCM